MKISKKTHFTHSLNAMMKILFLWLSGCLVVAIAPVLAQQTAASKNVKKAPMTVQMVEQSIKKIGGRATVEKYFFPVDDTPGADAQLERIDSGDKQWVDLAVRLLPYSDAGSTETLLSSLGTAMQNQPRNVLPYVNRSDLLAAPARRADLLSAQHICLPFISGEIPDAEALKIVRRSKKAISSVHDPALGKQCQACLVQVNELEKKIITDMARKK